MQFEKYADKEIFVLLFSGMTFFVLMAGCLIYFVVLYEKKQIINKRDKEFLQLEFAQELFKTQHEVQEQTMQTIGADLHDNIGQLLSLTSLTLNSVEVEHPEKAKEKVDAAIDLTLRSIKEMRLLGKLLQGDQLVVLGLPEAIRYEIAWMERSGKYKVTFLEDGDAPAAGNRDKDLILFRILQEVLNNIIKHAAATRVRIKLNFESSGLQLEVKDNGKGFDAEAQGGQLGMGFHNIQKRAAIIGGELSVASKPGKGTRVAIAVPYP